MYSTQPNGADSATINPAALSSELLNPTSRGVKRSRSPDNSYTDQPQTGTAGDDDHKPRKRGRPMKRAEGSVSQSPVPQTAVPLPPMPQVMQTPQAPANIPMSAPPPPLQSYAAPPPPAAHQHAHPHPPTHAHSAHPAHPQQHHPHTQTTLPPLNSPPAKPPTKTTIKALPTVRDHTTDQLGPGGDEYLPREIDEAGEKKVTANGNPLGAREYRCRTFFVPNRGEKLFMLATECARVLGYRDSYLLFNKNRSLFKIIASQEEKDDLVSQDILPFSYRSRQIAIVTARSMFRQFGSRVIVNGRRVRDDYWESKARKQGFTEEDLAGEKRPGAAKARAAEAAQQASLLGGPPSHQIVYSTTPQQFGEPPVQPGMIGMPTGTAARMPMITPGSDLSDRSRDYSNLIKGGPRQEITGPPYHDRTQTAPLADIQQQAAQAADYNRSVNQGRDMRGDYMQNTWRRPHEQPASAVTTLPQPIGIGAATADTTSTSRAGPTTSSMIPSQQSPQMNPYSQPSQAPMRAMPSQPPVQQKSQRQPSMPQSYNYAPSNQIWSPHQQPQTPQHGYSTYTTQAQASHPTQATTPQMRSTGVQPGMQFQGMPGMGQGYPAPGPSTMYPAEQTPRQYMPSNPSASPAVTQAWSNSQGSNQQWWATSQPQ